MGLYKRPSSPYWWYTFKLKGLKKVYASTEIPLSEKKAARLVFEKARLDAKEGKLTHKPTEVTVRDLLVEMLDKELDPVAREKKEGEMKLLFRDLGSRVAHEVTSDDIEDIRVRWQKEGLRKGKGIKKNSVNRYLRPLSAAYNALKKKYKLPCNPCDDVKFYGEDEFRRHVHVEENLLQAFINKLSPLTRTFIEFELVSGRRKGELLNMKWTDLNLDAGTLLSQKNKQKYPTVYPLHEDAIKILRRLPRIGQWVFCYPDGSKLKNDGQIKTEYNRVRAKMGLNHVRFHDLRHIFATKLTEATDDIYSTSQLLGHKDVKTTETYINYKSKQLRRQLNKLKSISQQKKVTLAMTVGLNDKLFSPN